MGVDFECNMVIGKVLTIDELMGEYGYEAVFVGSGAGLPRFMGIPGESLKGVYSANEFLTRSNLMKAYLPTSKTPIRTGRKVAVVGGGNCLLYTSPALPTELQRHRGHFCLRRNGSDPDRARTDDPQRDRLVL